MADEKIPGRHPNQDRWDRQSSATRAKLGSTDLKRANIRRAEARVERATDPSARRTAEIEVQERRAALDATDRGRKSRRG